MFTAYGLADLIGYVFTTHQEKARKPSKAVRKWDSRTPYGVHPVWCAVTLLQEDTLPEDLRVRGAWALLLHDILEDTTAELPANTPEEVVALVGEMTFPGGSAQEMKEIWSRSKETKLLKLYDKTSNLQDGTWMFTEKRAKYAAYLLRLCEEVERHYGAKLNILRIARALAR